MKYAAALTLLCFALAAIALEYTEDEKAKCDSGGGCVTMTMKALREMAKSFWDKGMEAGTFQCRT